MEIGLLLAVIIIVVVICVKKRNKKSEESAPSDVSGEIIIDVGGGIAEPPQIKGPAPNVIYAYPGKHTAVNCPSCDGENDINAASCAICGEKLVPRKR